MDHTTFPFGANFPSISAAAIDAACKTIETEWSGIFELYATTANPAGKQVILEGYLVGWWLADMNPSSATNIGSDGGMPLTGKSIGGVSLSRKDLEAQPALKQLESNAFGIKALSMIMAAPERFKLYGRTWSQPRGRAGWGGW